MNQRNHPTHHLVYAFAVGAVLTALGFLLAILEDRSSQRVSSDDALIVAGSESLRPWFAECASTFKAQQPGATIVVRGGGTSTGIAALLAGQVDLALSSRDLTEGERLRGARLAGGLQSTPVATGAVAVIVHPGVGADRLDLDTLGQLLDGTKRHWDDAAPQPVPVAVVGRESSSGTAFVVQQRILGSRSLASAAKRLATHDEVIDAVAATPGALGYVEASVAARREGPRVKVVAVSMTATTPSHLPSRDAIANGDYPLTRSMRVISRGKLDGLAAALVDHCRREDAAASPRDADTLVPLPAEAASDARR